MSHYVRFGLMITTSVVVMFCLKYLSTYEVSHVFYSETRTYMALMMGAAMAVIMLSFMLPMHKKKSLNVGIYVGSAVVFIAALFLVRSQTTVQDSSYMRSMIPHHSIAILTSERSEITDLRVRELADGIIQAQRKEIKEMDWLLKDIAKNGKATTESEALKRPVPNFEGKL
ncbi:MAG: DUF305 domain-containing protein [Pseudomonadales bacterium]|nr:DUF305 domain-containing protein [Pseudomonadales bacterium]